MQDVQAIKKYHEIYHVIRVCGIKSITDQSALLTHESAFLYGTFSAIISFRNSESNVELRQMRTRVFHPSLKAYPLKCSGVL